MSEHPTFSPEHEEHSQQAHIPHQRTGPRMGEEHREQHKQRAEAMAHGAEKEYAEAAQLNQRIQELQAAGRDTLVHQRRRAQLLTRGARLAEAHGILDDMTDFDRSSHLEQPPQLNLQNLDQHLPMHVALAAHDDRKRENKQAAQASDQLKHYNTIQTQARMEEVVKGAEHWAAQQGVDVTIHAGEVAKHGIDAAELQRQEAERRQTAHEFVNYMLHNPQAEAELMAQDHLRGSEAISEVMALYALPYARRGDSRGVEWALSEAREQMQNELMKADNLRHLSPEDRQHLPEGVRPTDPLTKRNKNRLNGTGV